MRTEHLVFAFTAVLSFGVYFLTSAPGLGLVDSGELTTAAHTLSIAHPTGYPLYTLLGRVWILMTPISSERAMVLFSVFWASIGCGLLAVLVMLLMQASGLPRRLLAVIAVLLTLGLGLSPSVWVSIAYAEVYPLSLMIAAAILLLAILQQVMPEGSHPVRIAVIACYLWGLGFGNHFTILWFFPIVIWTAARAIRLSVDRTRTAALMAGVFALGISVNLFLPIRSAVEPPFDWSDPQTLSHLIRHLSAWQYRVWMFKGDFAGFLNSLTGYIAGVSKDIGWPLLLLTLVGVIFAVARRAWVILIAFAVWLLGIAYNMNYSIPDISTYFTTFYAPLFVVAAYGFTSIARAVPPTKSLLGPGLAAIVVLVTAVPSYRAANRSGDTFARDYALTILAALPDSAVVFHGNWDIQSPVDYFQTVENVRPDVLMLDLALMQRPWYLKQELRKHPELFAGSEKEMAAFREAVAPFEAGRKYDANRIENAYVGMVNRIIENHYRSRPVYVRDTRNVGHPGVAANFPSYPGSYFFRIEGERRPEPLLNIEPLFRSYDERDERHRYLMRQVAVTAVMQGTFAADMGDTSRVILAAHQAQRISPAEPAVQQFLSRVKPYLRDTQSNP